MAKRRIEYDQFTDGELYSINVARRDLGLNPIVKKVRQCLRCDSEFISKGEHNRMCYKCATRNYY